MKRLVILFCVLAVMWTVCVPGLFLTAPCVGLLCAIVPFPGHTHFQNICSSTSHDQTMFIKR